MMCNVSNLTYGKRKGPDLENSINKKGNLQGRDVTPFSNIPLEILQKIFSFLSWKSVVSFSMTGNFANQTFSKLYGNHIVNILKREKYEDMIPGIRALQKRDNLSTYRLNVEIANYLSSELSLQKIQKLSKINDGKFKRMVEVAYLMKNLKDCFVMSRKFFGIPECFMQAVSSGNIEELNFMIFWYLEKCNKKKDLSMEDLDAPEEIFAFQATANLEKFFLFLIDSDRIPILVSVFRSIGKDLVSHPTLCNKFSLPLWLATLVKSYKQKEKIEEYLEKKTTSDFTDDFLKGALCIYEYITNRPLNIGEDEIESFFKKIDCMDFSFDFQIKLKKYILRLRYPDYPKFEVSKKIEILLEAGKKGISNSTFQS